MDIVPILGHSALPIAPGITFFDGWSPHREYLAALINGTVAGLVCFTSTSLWVPDALGLAYVSVATEHRRSGVSTALVKAFIALALSRSKAVYVTQYEPDGRTYLRPLLKRVAAAASVKLVEYDDLAGIR